MKPLQLEIAGQQRIFTPETTEVRLYRYEVDTVFNHVLVEEYGTLKVHLFNCPNLLTMLTGMEVPGHSFAEKKLDKALNLMDKKCGWNADVKISDSAPEEIKERYIRLATTALRKEVVVVPSEWT